MQLSRFRPDGLNNKAGLNSMSRNPRILIVEDEFFFANLIRTFLDKNGYKDLKHVDNALECLQQVREDRIPDIIILDYNLGNLDGVSTLKQIMAYKPDLKVILLSGQEDVEVAVQSIKKGARYAKRKRF
jgi:DNA-binding NtrC family response regulator